MNRSSLAVTVGFVRHLVPALLLFIGLPWIVYGQMGGMGGMGGGGMAGGGMAGGGMGMPDNPLVSRSKILEDLSKNPITWKRPDGPAPHWLRNGKARCEASESLRARLNEPKDLKLESMPLSEFVKFISDMWEIQIELDLKSLENEGISIEEAIDFKGTGPARELLRRVLEPHQLTYIVQEDSVDITSMDTALARPVIRYYDMGFVQSDSKHIAAIIETMEQAIQPEIWLSNGGACHVISIGQLLVVSATEKAHLEIEKLLFRLSPQAGGENPIVTR
ncbi:MAG: hypothetical protein ABL921_09080 [Pirellula sp.]